MSIRTPPWRTLVSWLVLTGGLAAAPFGGVGRTAEPSDEPLKPPTVVRFSGNPIIRPDMIPKTDGAHSTNLNFPCLIRVPDWIEKPLGKYYLYFSSHHGLYIRLAYADRPEGPWRVYAPGTLTMEQVEATNGEKPERGRHVATPDIHPDPVRKELRMYFHFKMPGLGHSSAVAVSRDGLHFEPVRGALGEPYFRVFSWQRDYYAIDRRGNVVKSADGLKDFRTVSGVIAAAAARRSPRAAVRHTGVSLVDDQLTVLYSRVGDAPESLWMTRVRLTPDPSTWKAATPVKLLEPAADYEGIGYPVRPSHEGEAENVRELRDPFVFREAGQTYLLYSVAGESGIALATLNP